MNKITKNYDMYVKILKRELIPSMGCTEPIAIAYAASVAREVLGNIPQRITISVSNNIVKNAKSVVVPNTNGLKGIKAAVLAGVLAGDAHRELEVIAEVTEEQKDRIREAMESRQMEINSMESLHPLDIIIELSHEKESVKVHIREKHANIIEVRKNDKPVEGWVKKSENTGEEGSELDYESLSLKEIIEFADAVDIKDVKDILDRQIRYNSRIAQEGLTTDYGANLGKTILKSNENSIKTRAVAKAAAGSDARMSGCELPVIINSGSGNQGITVSVPVIEYAKELQVSQDILYRALVISNLTSIHAKHGIGTLSAYCGAVTAGCAAGCGIAYLYGGKYQELAHTLVNSLAIVSGIICDGAKPSCAGKIASSIEAGILGYDMYINGQEFKNGDGIVDCDVERTIQNVQHLGKEGMKQTDCEIVKIMTK